MKSIIKKLLNLFQCQHEWRRVTSSAVRKAISAEGCSELYVCKKCGDIKSI
jgi:hypothetical protein